MIGCDCATCASDDPRDKRLRTGLLIEKDEHRIVVDISPDFRQQALRSGLRRLDALFITHCHADHVFGLDDIRPFNLRQGPLPIYASASTWQQLRGVFSYIFEAKDGGGSIPLVLPCTIESSFQVCGLTVTHLDVTHGLGTVSAFRFSDGRSEVAFITDCNDIPTHSLAKLRGLDLLVIDALRYRPHPTHLHLEKTLEYIAELRPRRALLTHMSHDIRHAEASRHLPPGVEFAFDQLQIEL